MSELSAKSILLVDDEAVIRRIVKRALSSLPREVEVCEAEDGFEAMEILGERTFDLVLLDVKMPGMSGFEVLDKIREKEATKGQKVMMLTSENQVEDIYQGRERGATSYLTKPFDVEEILLVLESHFSGEFDFDAEPVCEY
jgi:CheY-like chemotaxis protein